MENLLNTWKKVTEKNQKVILMGDINLNTFTWNMEKNEITVHEKKYLHMSENVIETMHNLN